MGRKQLPLRPSRTKSLKQAAKKTIETFSSWLDWLNNAGKDVVKKVNTKLEDLKEKIKSLRKQPEFSVEESRSAFRRFARQFTIKGKPGYAPRTFFEAVKPLVLGILKDNKQTKLKLVLLCNMERTVMATGQIFQDEAAFS